MTPEQRQRQALDELVRSGTKLARTLEDHTNAGNVDEGEVLEHRRMVARWEEALASAQSIGVVP